MAPFTKPEAVLKQAEGLVSVGQTHAALQSLTEMFTSKRFRSTPLTALEPILVRFVELCVDMRKGRTAKEGLMQYKNIAQNTNVASIEVVIQKFLALADAKVQEAQEKADRAVAVDVDDLEASETPESILLGAVSGDQSKDRTDRALVTPWLKFLWESYRTSLETLKNNARLEAIYQVSTLRLYHARRPSPSITSKSRSRPSASVSSTSARSSSVVSARPSVSTSPTSQNMRIRPMPSTSPTQRFSSTTSIPALHSSTPPSSLSSGKKRFVPSKTSTTSSPWRKRPPAPP